MDESTLFRETWRPQRPLCSHAKTGPYKRRSANDALRYEYIETNPACVQSLVIADVDTADVRDMHLLLPMPAPTWVVAHPLPGGMVTGHIAYGLATPVITTDAAHRRPVNLLARIEIGIRDVFQADVSYAGRFTKNPLRPPAGQMTLWGGEGEELPPLYGLRELAAALDTLGALPSARDRRPRKASGIGRNVDVFERVRKWSYGAVRRYWSDGYDDWSEAVFAKTSFVNMALQDEGREPLPDTEIKHLSRSVSSWVWRRFTPESFSEVQTKRIQKRWGQSRSAVLAEVLNG